MRPRARPKAPCRCGSGRRYESCCGPLHKGAAAPTAEALMRSRYSAYALHKPQYILDTTDPEGPHYQTDAAAWRRDVLMFSRKTAFEGLEVLEHGEDGDRAHVLFVASLAQDGVPTPMRERSAFRRDNGRWYYVCAESE